MILYKKNYLLLKITNTVGDIQIAETNSTFCNDYCRTFYIYWNYVHCGMGCLAETCLSRLHEH